MVGRLDTSLCALDELEARRGLAFWLALPFLIALWLMPLVLAFLILLR